MLTGARLNPTVEYDFPRGTEGSEATWPGYIRNFPPRTKEEWYGVPAQYQPGDESDEQYYDFWKYNVAH